MSKKLTSMLTIAGSDPTGGAGIQADIKAAAFCRVYAMSVVSAVTAQNSKGISLMSPVSALTLSIQLKSLTEEIIPDAVKTGMIGSVENAGVVFDYFKTLPAATPIVIDPVATASAGGNLSSDNTSLMSFYKESLLPLATVCTPNIPELYTFLGEIPDAKSADLDKLEAMAREFIRRFGCHAIVVKGGHSDSEIVTDLLIEKGKHSVSHVARRIDCINLHGTGCTYASLTAAFLARGLCVKDAFLSSSKAINTLIAQSCGYSFGSSSYGPLNIFDFNIK